MTSSTLQDAIAGRAILRPWTVDLCHRALESGWLEESTAFELLEGFIVRKDRAKAGGPCDDRRSPSACGTARLGRPMSRA